MDEWMKLKLKTNEEEEKLRNEKLTIELEVARLMKKVEEAKKDLKVAEDRGVEAGKAVEQAAKEFKSETHVDPCDAVAVTPPSSDSASPREAAAETFVTISKRKRKFVVSRGSTSEKLGLFFSNNTTEITRVYPGFAAARAKLQTGMIIREINGNVTNTLKEVDNFLRDGSWLELRLLVEEDFTEADATEEEEEYIIVPAQASETTLPDNGDPRSPVEKTHDNHFPVAAEKEEKLQQPQVDEKQQEEANNSEQQIKLEEDKWRCEEKERKLLKRKAKEEAKRSLEQDNLKSTAAAQEMSPKDIPTDFVMPELESFKQFCKEYAEKHPEMMNNEEWPEDANEETVRMLEQRRRRELEEDPTAIKQLLMETIKTSEHERRADEKKEPSLSDLLISNDWKLDYARRVLIKEQTLTSTSLQDNCSHDT